MAMGFFKMLNTRYEDKSVNDNNQTQIDKEATRKEERKKTHKIHIDDNAYNYIHPA